MLSPSSNPAPTSVFVRPGIHCDCQMRRKEGFAWTLGAMCAPLVADTRNIARTSGAAGHCDVRCEKLSTSQWKGMA